VRLIVDGYNLYFTGLHPGEAPTDPRRAREAVIDAVSRYAAARRVKAVVFFDGGPAGQHMPRRRHEKGLEVRFSDPRLDADNDIKHAVTRCRPSEAVRVVTSDNDIARFVKRLGAQVTRAQDFAAELRVSSTDRDARPRGEPAEKYEGAGAAEVDYWLREFARREGSPSTRGGTGALPGQTIRRPPRKPTRGEKD